MRLEVVRLTADWLKDDTYGVAAKATALPKDVSGEGPATITDSAILDETRHREAAVREFDKDTPLPCLIVVSGDVTYQPAVPIQLQAYADGLVAVQVFYVTRDVDEPGALTDGDYAIKAVLASLRDFHLADSSTRTRNSVQVISIEGLRELGGVAQLKDAWITAGAEVTFYARTAIPLGS